MTAADIYSAEWRAERIAAHRAASEEYRNGDTYEADKAARREEIERTARLINTAERAANEAETPDPAALAAVASAAIAFRSLADEEQRRTGSLRPILRRNYGQNY